MKCVVYNLVGNHAREPLYSKGAFIAWCRHVHKIGYIAVLKGNIFVNI